MDAVRVAIPLYGKMATRSFHTAVFRQALEARRFTPLYWVGPHYFRMARLNPSQYFELQTDRYDELLGSRKVLSGLAELRRFAVRTETTDLRLRETIGRLLFTEGPVAWSWLFAAGVDLLRRLPGLGRTAAACESLLFRARVHEEALRREGVGCVLTPGTGSYGFWNEGLFAREARRMRLPVFASITNYDNILNMGYRGFMPDCLAVWSRQMADDVIRLQHIPASRIEVTGPVQYDRYFGPVGVGREEFFRAKGLDPARKTILYAGGVNITRYFEIYRLLLDPTHRCFADCNVVIRVYPHAKLLSSPGWQMLEEVLLRIEGVYISNSLSASADSLVAADLQRDLDWAEDVDELHGLLKYSDVMINHFSTISLEAAICDLPVVHVGYDAYTFGHHYNTSAAFQQRQTHNRRKLRLAAAKIARDEVELVKGVEAYLQDRSADAAARHEYALSECGYLDGRSSVRLTEMLRQRMAALSRSRR